MIPALIELRGADQHLYQAAALTVNFFVVVPAAYQHFKARAVDVALVRKLLPIGVVAVVLGVIASEHPWFAGEGEARLRTTFGLFLMSICAYEIYRMFRSRRSTEPPTESSRSSWRFAAIVAIPSSLVGGLLGVGGGLLSVPLQRRFLGVPLRVAIANSATLIIATSLVGATVKNYAWIVRHDDNPLAPLVLAAILAPTAMLGAYLGSRWTHRLPRRILHLMFLLLMLVVGWRLI